MDTLLFDKATNTVTETTTAPPRVALIGPVLPFRGGIAQHTTRLHRAVGELSEVHTWSFSRQYPQWIFPGESDRDPSFQGHVEPRVEYSIDSLNPLTWKKTAAQIHEFNPQTLIIPWWTIFWAPTFRYFAKTLKSPEREIVFFCHNVIDHESSFWKTLLSKNVLKLADRFITHTRQDAKKLVSFLPHARVTVHPHPIYDQFPPAKGILPRRAKLELLFYGFVRPYKGLDQLIEAMGLLKGKDIYLTIAGEFWKGEEETRNRIIELGIENQVELRPRYHTDQETAELFHRADFVVLPYRSATGSGVIPIAYHYNKPVIASNVGGLPDVVKNNKTGFIIEKTTPKSLRDVFIRLLNTPPEQMDTHINNIKSYLSWRHMAEHILLPT